MEVRAGWVIEGSSTVLARARREQIASLEQVLAAACAFLPRLRGVDAAVLKLRIASARREARNLRNGLQ